MHTKKSLLVILDGWGIGNTAEVDAIQQANTPVFDGLKTKYNHNTLITYGEDVGLPDGQMGNSEVGHLNIGAGRIVHQELVRINNACKNNTLKDETAIKQMIHYANTQQKPIHLMGLLSDGGVHAHIDHLKAIIQLLEDADVQQIYVHAFMDGRDTAPDSGMEYMRDLLDFLEGKRTKLATIIGRYYSMDRDNRFERIKLAYDLLINGKGQKCTDPLAAIQASYDAGVLDEFIMPICLQEDGHDIAHVSTDDAVFFYNFRTDRPRQLTQVLSQTDMLEYQMNIINLQFYTMTEYDESFQNLQVVFKKEKIKNTIGEVVAAHGLTQLRIAETEKYPHVTFFFSGGREEAFEGEERILIPSPKVPTYDLQPEMSAPEITSALIEHIDKHTPDFICLNYANTDMVGHTGVMKAAIQAAEAVDQCLGLLIDKALEHDYEILVIADHGNSDIMQYEDGSPHTAHTTNLVPLIYVSNAPQGKLQAGKLADVAPTLLDLMGIPSDALMDGESLIASN